MDNRENMGFKIGFKGKVLGLSLPFLIIMVVLLIWIAYAVSKNNIINSSERLLNTSAKDQTHQIESWMNQKLKEVSTIKYDIEHSGVLANDKSLQEKLNSYYGLDSDFVDGFYVADLSGTMLKAAESQKSTGAVTSQVWFQEGITRVNPSFTRTYVNEDNIQVISASGMFNDDKNIRVLSADLTLDSVNIIVNSSVSMPNAESLLIDKADGAILVARDSSLISTKLGAVKDNFFIAIADKIAKGDYSLGLIEGNYYVIREIGGTNWLLVSYIPASYITKSVDSLRNTLILIAIISLVIICVIMYINVHLAVNPLRDISKKIKSMSNGDFTIKVTPRGNDEIADIQRSVNVFIQSMRHMINEIISISTQLKSQADMSSGVADNMLDASRTQAGSMSDLNNTMSQFNISINEIARNATELSNFVSETTEDSDIVKEKIDGMVEVSQRGRQDMQRVIDAMTQIRNSIDELVKAINKVGSASNEITGIIGLIGNISEETALLSLNASIEAARAGESGRGFAVVASEISKLADTTANSVDNISVLIKEVDSLIEAAVGQAEVSVGNINESSERIHVAVNTFDEIYGSINEVENVIRKMVEEIEKVNSVAMGVSAVSEEQAASTEVIYNTSEKMVQQANDFETESEKVADGAKVLMQTSDQLTQHMDRFKI